MQKVTIISLNAFSWLEQGLIAHEAIVLTNYTKTTEKQDALFLRIPPIVNILHIIHDYAVCRNNLLKSGLDLPYGLWSSAGDPM